MGISHRKFLIDPQDRIFRLAMAKYMAMLRQPDCHRLAQFAGQRIRSAGIAVTMRDRRPVEVVWSAFDILTFDESGRLKADTFLQQQLSRAELAMSSMIGGRERNVDLIDTATRFIADGGRWVPSRAVASAIHDAALGRRPCTAL